MIFESPHLWWGIRYYLVTTPRGTRFKGTDFAKVWKKAVEKAGITPMTSYIARHLFAA
jgi:integrase